MFVDWQVKLSVPSLEGEVPHQAATIRTSVAFYARNSNVGLWYKDDGGDDPRPVIPGIRFNVVYRTELPFYLDMPDQVSGNYDKVMMTNDPQHGVTLWIVDHKGKTISSKPNKNQWILSEQTILSPIVPEIRAGMEFLSLRPSTAQSVQSLVKPDLGSTEHSERFSQPLRGSWEELRSSNPPPLDSGFTQSPQNSRGLYRVQ